MNNGQSTRAGMPIRATRLHRFLVVVALTTSATALANLLFPRLIRHNFARIKGNATLKAALHRYNAARLKTAGTTRSDFAVLTHTGRRSGRTYQTPLGAHTFGDGVILPLAYGSQTDWYRNVLAAGKCTLARDGRTYALERPGIISGPEVMRAWPITAQIMLRAVGIHEFLWLHETTDQAVRAWR
jgi:deazaflavin-dependent oxidoreductase (nitroreductase family)